MNVLETKNICKIYHQGEVEIKALDNVSLEIEKGSFVAITGESGSGKSTLVNILGCMDQPTSGKLLICNEEVTQEDAALSKIRGEKIGMIFQGFHLLPMLTVEENILMPGRFAGKKTDGKAVGELIEKLSLNGRETHLPSELSGGQQQRVAIGRALINKPEILLADEPTGNLDKKTSEEIMNLLVSMKKDYNMTLVVVTHSAKIAEMADRRILMEDGRIVKDERKNE